MEEWKAIPHFEGHYAASSEGRIKSLERQVVQKSRSGNKYKRVMKEKILTPRLDAEGRYFYANLSVGGSCGNFAVHRLVLLTFVGEPPEGKPEGCHKNGDSHDNALSNLKWGSRAENEEDKTVHGTIPRGENHYAAKFSDADCVAMRADWFSSTKARGEQSRLSKKHNVSRRYFMSIVSEARRAFA